MSRTDSVRLLVALVCLLGLASCSRDERKGSSREARTFGPPTVMRQGIHFDVTTWPTDHTHVSSLTDTLELSHPAPAITDVNTICFDSKGAKSETFRRFNGENEIAFFRVLPDEVLFQDLATDPSRCEFVVQMTDNGIKKNGFRAFNQFNEDGGTLKIEGQKVQADGKRPRLVVNDLFSVRVSHAAINSGNAELSCRDADFQTVPFHKSVTLGQFPIANPSPRNSARVHPNKGDDQLCRVIVRDPNTDSPVGVTPLLKLRFNEAPLDIEMTEVTFTEFRGTLTYSGFYPLASYAITNPTDEVQSFKFNSEWYDVRLRLNLKANFNSVDEVHTRWGRMFVADSLAPRALVAGEVTRLDPGQTATFLLAFNPAGDMLCDHLRVRMMPTEAVYIDYLDRRGNVVLGKPLPLPRELTKIQWEPRFQFTQKEEIPGPGICRY